MSKDDFVDAAAIAEIYTAIGNNVLSFFKEKRYIDDANKLIPACYSLVAIATELISKATDMSEQQVVEELTVVMVDTLNSDNEDDYSGVIPTKDKDKLLN